ncbi:MAG: hypothetical protein GTN80_00845 [Nitrososphaeria archaeon]|nr:hypothetical protein [Nitrososphaeria archaeon]NIQ32193.1 hypothetical protein [Nitrososphaeria archaeon]
MKIGGLEIDLLGGVNGIGGNLILITYGDSKIVLDLGVQLSSLRRYYTWPTRMPRDIHELIKLGLAPRVEDLYADWTPEGDVDLEKQPETDVAGVFLSHFHLDHTYLISQINRRIPLFMGEGAKVFFDFTRETRRETRFWRLGQIETRTFRTREKVRCGVFEVYPVHIDHSIPSAYGFIVETPEGAVAYTGDFRMHGPMRSFTKEFARLCAESEPEVLISEGTNFYGVSTLLEGEVREEVTSVMKSVKGAVLASFSEKDVDRFKSYVEAAELSGRRILSPHTQIYLIHKLRQEDPKLRNTLPKVESDLFSAYHVTTPRGSKKKICDVVESLGIEVIDARAHLEGETLRSAVVTSFVPMLQSLSTVDLPEGTTALFSESEPRDEEGEIEHERILNWLDHIGIPSYRIHCSGHIYPHDLKKVVQEIDPNKLEIIHSEHPEALKRFLIKK